MYLKLAYRNLFRNRLSSFINLSGLSVAIACSIVFFLLLDKEYTSDRFHKNAAKTFMVVYTLEGDVQSRRWGDSPLPLGPTLASDSPNIERAVRILDIGAMVQVQDHVFRETVRFADPDFLEMFTFPLSRGRDDALSDQNSLILSRDQAEKYFGDTNPVGQELVVTMDGTRPESFLVSGVAEKFPYNASFGFALLGNLNSVLNGSNSGAEDWGRYASATFVQYHVTDPLRASVDMSRYVERHNASNVDRPIASVALEPLSTLSWESQDIQRSISSGSTPQALILLFVIGLFLLIQACFNYVNITLGSSSRRFKEIGIRKVVGCQRGQLVRQFLGENVVMCLMALAGGLLVTELVFLPGLMWIGETAERFTLLDFFGSSHFWIYLVFLLGLTSIGAGAYPAFLISRLQPVHIMRSVSAKLGGKKRFTNALLSLQFAIAFVILCLVAAFLQNNRYQQQRDWGYTQEHVINVSLNSDAKYAVLRAATVLNPDVIGAAGTVHPIGRSRTEAVVEISAEKHEVVHFEVGPEYLETMGVRLRKGRFFRPDLSTDAESAAIVNEQFVRVSGWNDAVDQTLKFENRTFTVIGVIEDFHYDFFFEEIEPAFLRLAPEEKFTTMSVRVSAETGVRSADFLRQTWQKVFPNVVYDAYFQDSVFESGYRNSMVITRIFSVTAAITLLISCMGLFGLVTLMISRRMKELSIHKVLGASVRQISFLITKRYVILLSVAMLLALPFSYFFLRALLDGVYKYHMPLGPLPFLLAGLVVLLTAFLTVAAQVYKAAVRDPIEAMRYE